MVSDIYIYIALNMVSDIYIYIYITLNMVSDIICYSAIRQGI